MRPPESLVRMPGARAVLDRMEGRARTQRDSAVVQFVQEFVDRLLVDEIEKGRARLDRVTATSRDGGIFDADPAGVDQREAARQFRQAG